MSKKEKIFRLAWDCDGVLVDSHIPILEEANKRLNQHLGKEIKLTKVDLIGWDAIYYKTLELSNNDEKLAHEIKGHWYNPEIIRRSPPNPAMIEVFRRC